MSDEEVDEIGARLARAKLAETLVPRRECDLRRIDSFESAGAVQTAGVLAFSPNRIGWALAAAAPMTSRLLRCDHPIVGPLFSEDRMASGSTLPVRSSMLGISAGFSFVFGRSYPAEGEPIGPNTALGAIASCHVGLQVLGRRVPGDTPLNERTATADFGLAEAYVEGPRIEGWRDRKLAEATILLRMDGHVCAAGRGDTLGSPFEAVAWLARQLSEVGGGGEAGDIVATGSCTGLAQTTPGTAATGDFGDLGTVELRLV